MTDRQERFKRSPGGPLSTPGRPVRGRKSVAFDLPEEESPVRVERSVTTPSKKFSFSGEFFEGDSCNFGFKPGQEETLDLSFNSAEKPNFGQRMKRQTDEMDVDKDQEALFEHKLQPRQWSELMPPPARKSIVVTRGQDSHTPKREARQQSKLVYSPSVGHGRKTDEHSDVVMGEFYDQIQGEGLMDTDEIETENWGGATERQKISRRSSKPPMETVPEESVPLKRERSDSLSLTEELFGPRKSIARPSEFQGQRVSMVPTTALFTAAPTQVPKRPSFSITAELSLTGVAEPQEGYPTVKELFSKTLIDNGDVDEWFKDSKPPIINTPEPSYESRAELLVRMVKSRIKLEKYEIGMKWAQARKEEMKKSFKNWERETDADPESSTLFPLLEKCKEAWGNKEKENLLEMEVERQVELCEKAAKEEWEEQLLRMEKWHSEALHKATQDLENFNKKICEKIEAARKEEEKRKVVQAKMKELADLKALSESKRRQQVEHKEKAWEKRMEYLGMQKEILEIRASRKEEKETATEKKLFDITNELSVLFALQPFTLEDIATNSAGNLNAKVSVQKIFHLTLENFPKSDEKKQEEFSTITIEATKNPQVYRPKLHAAMCALAALPEKDHCFRQAIEIPHPIAQYSLQKTFKALKTVVDFVSEIDALHCRSPVTYLGWELTGENKILFQFGNARAGCLAKLSTKFSPEVYPYEDSLEFSVEFEFKKSGVELTEDGILEEIRKVKFGLGYVSRVVEKMIALVGQDV